MSMTTIITDSVTDTNTVIKQYSIVFCLLRWTLLGFFFCSWRFLILHYAKRRNWRAAQTLFWLTQRRRIFLWLILFELIVCENGIVSLIRLLSHGVL